MAQKFSVIFIIYFCMISENGSAEVLRQKYFSGDKCSQQTSINVLALGARSEEGFDNTKIFQYCLDNYKEVYIPTGIYEYSNIVISKSGVRLYGDGKGKTILKSSNSTKLQEHLLPNIRILNDTCVLENLTSTYQILPDYKLNANGRNSINEDANISVGWSEADAPSMSYIIKNVTIQNCEVIGSFVQGIAIGVSTGVKILNNTVTQTRGTGVFGYYADKISVVGNKISKTGDDGIYISANGVTKYSPHGRNRNVLIQYNEITNSSAKGIGLSGTDSAEISFNIINSTFADGILISKDDYYGHVSARNLKIHNNILSNIFGEFGVENKHPISANIKYGGFYGMIAVITDEGVLKSNRYEIYNNTASADKRLAGKYGYYGSYIFGHNIEIYQNKFSNGNFGIMIGNPVSIKDNSSSSIILKNNEFDNFKRNVVLIKVADVLIANNIFGDADWCITEERVTNIQINSNTFTDRNKFFLNQTGSKVSKNNNRFSFF